MRARLAPGASRPYSKETRVIITHHGDYRGKNSEGGMVELFPSKGSVREFHVKSISIGTAPARVFARDPEHREAVYVLPGKVRCQVVKGRDGDQFLTCSRRRKRR